MLATQSDKPLSLAERALELMQNEYAHMASPGELAARLGVSQEHLIRTYSARMHETPGQALTRIRLENACRYLCCRPYSVEIIAGLTGFSCGNYFCKVFRRAYGVSPLCYRAAHWDEQASPPEGEITLFI